MGGNILNSLLTLTSTGTNEQLYYSQGRRTDDNLFITILHVDRMCMINKFLILYTMVADLTI